METLDTNKNDDISLGGIFNSPNKTYPDVTIPRFDIGKIYGTGINLGDSYKIYPEQSSKYVYIVENNNKIREITGSDIPTPFLTPASVQRMQYHENAVYLSTKDPRQPFNDTPESPNGFFDVYVNANTQEFQILPKILKEPFKTAMSSPYGPIRTNESDMRRLDAYTMYSLKNAVLSMIGVDSIGRPVFSDGNTFVEKCINMGYYKSTIPFKIWKPVQQKSALNKQIKLSSENGEFTIITKTGEKIIESVLPDKSLPLNIVDVSDEHSTITFLSKSGYYFTNRPPIKGMFLGFIDVNDAEKYRPLRNVYRDMPSSVQKYFYNDRICENELSSTGFRYGVLVKNKPTFLNGREENLFGDRRNGYRKMLSNLEKVDTVQMKVIDGVSTPTLKRKIEQYGPNPIQHIFYMDYYDWRKYTTVYIPEDEHKLKIKNLIIPQDSLYKESFSDKCTFPLNNFGNMRGRFDVNVGEDGVFYLTDTTHILDIYFGLMEMHIKSFSWDDIFRIIDLIPDFRGEWNDSQWNSLSFEEKTKIRLTELNEKLSPIWELLRDILANN